MQRWYFTAEVSVEADTKEQAREIVEDELFESFGIFELEDE